MDGVSIGQLAISKAKTIAIPLFAALFVMFIFPVAAHAEPIPPTPPTLEVPTKDGQLPNENNEGEVYVPNPAVETPGAPVATSPTTDRDIEWEWTPPVNGTTPDATVETPTETPTDPAGEPTEPTEVPPVETPPAQHSTDITHYGYELTEDGTVIVTGVVESTVNKVSTRVNSRGTYVFRLWSITRAAEISESVYANATIVNPVLPTVPPIVVPTSLDTAPIDAIPAINEATALSTVFYNGRNVPVASSNVASTANVRESSDSKNNAPSPRSDIATVINASSKGWVLAGLPWYIWLLVAAIIFTSWRWIVTNAKSKE
jgi:hypothetical protein